MAATVVHGEGLPAGPPPPVFDRATVETITGTVYAVEEVVDQVAPMWGICCRVQLVVRTDDETLTVLLGPSWYVEREIPALHDGDRISVRGSRVDLEGEPAVLAVVLHKGRRTVEFRDADGTPKWTCP